MALVGGAGTMKSHPLRFAFHPLQEIDNLRLRHYKEDIRDYKNTPKDERDERPIPFQRIVRDCTFEALGRVLNGNRNGVVYYVDELKGWTASFDRYSKGGGDQEKWLSLYNGDSLTVNRKSEDEILSVPHPYVNVIGTTQYSALPGMFPQDRIGNGFLPRILFVNNSSEGQPLLWAKEDLPSNAEDRWKSYLYDVLSAIDKINLDAGPRALTFDSKAWGILCNWQNCLETDLMEKGSEYEIESFRKIQLYALRFCLLVHMMHHYKTDKTVITAGTVYNAISLSNYFFKNSIDIYEIIRSGGVDHGKFNLFLNALNVSFTTSQAVEVGRVLGISQRTVYRYLDIDQDNPFIRKVGYGKYEKIL